MPSAEPGAPAPPPTRPAPGRRSALARLRPLLVPVLVGTATLALLAATEPLVPLTDDARFYLPAAQSYARWLERAALGPFSGDLGAYSRAALDAAFAVNNEHPPVAKYALGLSWLVAARWLGHPDEACAARLGVMALSALTAALVFGFTRRHWGLAAALAAWLALLAMPRFFFHAHAETLDAPMACLGLATIVAYERSLRAARWAWVAALCFGLALGTKLNAPFILLGLVAHLLWWQRGTLAWRGSWLRAPAVPLALPLLLVIGPLVFVALWPWLWFDTLGRLQAYARFHLNHYGILFYYFGTLYGERHAPWTAPWVMLALTTPLSLLAAALLAPLLAISNTAKRLVTGRAQPRPLTPPEQATTAPLALIVFQLLAAVGAVSFSPAPVYGGVKLFLIALPLLAILVGAGVGALLPALVPASPPGPDATPRPQGTPGAAASAAASGGLRPTPGQRRALLALALILALLAAPAADLVRYRGYWLSYYNELAGGLRGATAAGLERQYYDLAYPALAACLEQQRGSPRRVAFAPNPKEYGPHLEQWLRRGQLGAPWRLVEPAAAELLVLTQERRWANFSALEIEARRRPELCRVELLDVPLATVHGRPPG